MEQYGTVFDIILLWKRAESATDAGASQLRVRVSSVELTGASWEKPPWTRQHADVLNRVLL